MVPGSSWSSSFWVTCGVLLLTTTTAASYALYLSTFSNSQKKKKRISVAFLGNSIQYFNDSPRLVEAMLRDSGITVQQDSCLRPGASLAQLWAKGNGMRLKFSTPPARLSRGRYDIGAPTPTALLQFPKWDYVLFQDHTQHPTRPASRDETLNIFKDHFVPLLRQCQPGATILFLQTFAYRVPGLKSSQDLGNFDGFTDRLVEGYDIYAHHMRKAGFAVQIVPVGRAVQWLYKHRRHDLWESLYSWDDFHPSPHGTWLQACLIFLALTQGRVPPPKYNPLWWDECRYMQPPEEKPLPLPTVQEAEDLRQVAMMIHHAEAARVKQTFTNK